MEEVVVIVNAVFLVLCAILYVVAPYRHWVGDTVLCLIAIALVCDTWKRSTQEAR